jgi:long-chain acyl-CoA synthetase
LRLLTLLISLPSEPADRLDDAEIRSRIQASIDAINAKTARVRPLKKFAVLGEPLSIANGEMTPTLKVKRNVVRERFADEIEAMYA